MLDNFITYEGPEKAGKSTQFRLSMDYLASEGIDFISVREPGGDRLSEQIRSLLLTPGNEIEDMAELFLYEAARANLVIRVITPNLAEGRVVLCDRYTDSSIAYQAYGRGMDLDIVTSLNDLSTGGIYPGLTLLYLDRFAQGDNTRLESVGEEFNLRVEGGYRTLAAEEPERIKIVRTVQADTVEESVRRTFEEGTLPLIKNFLRLN